MHDRQIPAAGPRCSESVTSASRDFSRAFFFFFLYKSAKAIKLTHPFKLVKRVTVKGTVSPLKRQQNEAERMQMRASKEKCKRSRVKIIQRDECFYDGLYYFKPAKLHVLSRRGVHS